LDGIIPVDQGKRNFKGSKLTKSTYVPMKLTADRIFDGNQFLQEDMVVIVSPKGRIMDLVKREDAGDDIRQMTGTILPGFVNAHCHLELSHLKGQIERSTGLVGFLSQVVGKRSFPQDTIREAMVMAEREMYEKGVQAVGDICNTTDSLPVKSESRMHWYNFIEVLSSRDEFSEQRIAHFTGIRNMFRESADPLKIGHGFNASLAPHAPYSVSPISFRKINESTSGEIVSLHSQESPAEDFLYKFGTGPFTDFFRMIGLSENPIPVTGISSLQSVLPHFNRHQRIILVHNTCTSEDDIGFAKRMSKERGLDLHFCLCPNANLYIEERLPPVELLQQENCSIVLGTDSLASNDELSIAAEIRTIHRSFPSIPLETILQWATSNGACALGLENEIGTLTPGKSPGILLLDKTLRAVRIC
jgi:cytosine/adenosine deaminase-related metal-dependent hydrolase